MTRIKTPILSAIAFFGTLGILSVGYSAYVSSYPATATAGVTALSAGEWNKMVSALQTLDTNLSAFTITPGEIGIGTKVKINSTSVAPDPDLVIRNGIKWTSFVQTGTGSYNPITWVGQGLFFTNDNVVSTATDGFTIAPWSTTAGWIRIMESGLVWIGTSTPTAHLEVSANVPSSYTSIVNNNTSAWGVRWAWLNGSTGSPLGAGKMCFETGGICRLNLDSSGNVWASSVTATTVTATSDARYKENVATASGLETVATLRGVEFDWKNGSGKSSGVIAQELETVLPHLVATDSSVEKMKSVNYAGLSAYFIEAIKELKKRNDVLETKNVELEKRLEALEASK